MVPRTPRAAEGWRGVLTRSTKGLCTNPMGRSVIGSASALGRLRAAFRVCVGLFEDVTALADSIARSSRHRFRVMVPTAPMHSALSLRDLALDDAASVDAVAAFLDGLSHDARL